MEVNVYMLKSKENNKGKAPLRIHVGSYIKVPLNISVKVKNWNEDKQRVTSSEEFYFIINEKIEAKIKKINKYLINNESPTEEDVREILNSLEEGENKSPEPKASDLKKTFDLFIQRKENILSTGYLRNVKNAYNHILDYSPNAKIENINTKFFEGYVKYLATKKKPIENVTIQGYISRIQNVLRDSAKYGIKVSPDFEDFSLKVGEYKNVRITWDEVEAIDKVNHFNPIYNEVKDAFIFRCNTGLRDTDYESLNKTSFVKISGRLHIKLNSNKGDKDQLLVLNKRATEIAKKYHFNIPKLAQQTFNRIIKFVARAAKSDSLHDSIERVRHILKDRNITVNPKWKFITTHSARRAFARRWYDLGGKIIDIMHFLGHSNEKQTRVYIGIDDDDVNSSMITAFD
jgi:integrase